MKQLIGILILALLIVACAPVQDTTNNQPLSSESGLKKFQSAAEVKDYLKTHQATQYNYYRGGMMAFDTATLSAVKESAAPMGAGASDYSQTNNQVAAVDEADFIKNDGKYIYTLANNVLVIVEAYPAEDANVVSKTVIDGYPSNIFLNGDRVVVLTTVDSESYVIPQYEIIPQPSYKPITKALVYDVSNREHPELEREVEINGQYRDARMIGEFVYAIAQEGVYYYNDILPMPMVKTGNSIIRPEVYYIDNPADSYVFHTIASINLETGDVNAETLMLGWSSVLYMSEDNLYITYQKTLPYEDYSKDRFEKAMKPLLPADVRAKVDAADSWDEISAALDEMYASMSKEEKETFVKRAQEALTAYERQKDVEQSKTIIQRVEIDNGDIIPRNQGEVPGNLLNQFSLDESEGNLRVATTTNLWRTGESFSNVYVLDEDMEVIGALENLAKGERIYAARFLGERLYLVTFKRIDPLFVISLEDPAHPKVLGELKIPGYSDYLHPIDENHLIGVGKETKDNEWGGVSTQGVKVAVFDVTDVENPTQVNSVEIGRAGSDSEALYDHKAFLYNAKTGLLVIPVREVLDEPDFDGKRGYMQNVWQGAYVLNADKDGVAVKGKVQQHTGEEELYAWWGSPYAIKRSLYMDDVLYTVSSRKIQMNSLDTLDKIGEVTL
ncbi:MAG: beta-propeller domain-containing protein, partial [Nanoarchaeota archaeon]|nr:beta-propeller domain-containing protein [Nanoarchaeota archaeon]